MMNAYACNGQNRADEKQRAVIEPVVNQIAQKEICVVETNKGMVGFEMKRYGTGGEFVANGNVSPKANP